jgi:hypothetical protein
MPNLNYTSGLSYTRHPYMGGSAITVTGHASAGVTVRVMIIPKSEDNFSNFLAKYNSVSTKNNPPSPSVAPMVVDGGGGPPTTGDWSAEVSVTGLPAGTNYVIYADDGSGKCEPQDPVTIN